MMACPHEVLDPFICRVQHPVNIIASLEESDRLVECNLTHLVEISESVKSEA